MHVIFDILRNLFNYLLLVIEEKQFILLSLLGDT